MNRYKIAMYPGDGIGIEVVAEVEKVLRAVEKRFGFGLDLTEFNWGGRYWAETGKVTPDDFLDTLKGFDAIFLGAVGDPKNVPDHITGMPLFQMRQGFDQYVCLRPARLLPGVRTPLADVKPGDIDIMVVRENSEGEYAAVGGNLKTGTKDEVTLQTSVHTRKGVERILRFAFQMARRRKKHLTMATKSNALKFSMVMWDRVFAEVKEDFPDVRADKFHIDALSMYFVQRPKDFDVVVASNLFGDILSDLGGAIAGSIGLSPSANINPEKDFPSLFEPVHGSAPDIVGKGIANPVAAIQSAAMMLDFLGESDAARHIERVVDASLVEASVVTPDLGGKASTSEVGDDIARRILDIK